MAEGKNSHGRGKKECPKCLTVLASATKTCECGYKFESKKKETAKGKKSSFSITENQIRVVMAMSEKLNENPDLTAESIQEDNKPIDLNDALDSGMSSTEIKKLIKRRESQKSKVGILNEISKRELNKIIDTLKEPKK